jgi:DNA-binding IclR family transcriptional regulator
MLVEIANRIKIITPLYTVHKDDADAWLTAERVAVEAEMPVSSVIELLGRWARWGYCQENHGLYRLTDAGIKFADKIK